MSQDENLAKSDSVAVTRKNGAVKPGSRAAKSQLQIDVESGMSYADASAKYNMPEVNIRARASRGKWMSPGKIARITRLVTKQMVPAVTAAIANDEIEKHKRKVFEIGSESVRKFKSKAPRNFSELKIADDLARRSAGIDDRDEKSVSLVLVNEQIEAFEPTEAAPQPATVLPDAGLPDAGLPDDSLGNVAGSQEAGSQGSNDDSLGEVIDGELMPDNPATTNPDSSLVHDTEAGNQGSTLVAVAPLQGSTLPA